MSRLPSKSNLSTHHYEIETTEGLEFITQQELLPLIKHNIVRDIQVRNGAITCISSHPQKLCTLKTVVAVYVLDSYDVPRPKALLGHQHFTRLCNTIQFVRQNIQSPCTTFYLSAAGSDSSVMERLKADIASATGLNEAEQGDILLRIRRTKTGWDVLTRLTNRPLATRSWRVCNMEGALNAPVAHAMIWLSRPQPEDIFLNIACGSGTLLIERLIHSRAKQVIGCDINDDALRCASENITQAGYNHHIQLINADGGQLPLMDEQVTVICADLPFGQLIGSHRDNMILYPQILTEIERVLIPTGRAIVITHEIRLMNTLIPSRTRLKLDNQYQIVQRGLHPCIYVFRKSV